MTAAPLLLFIGVLLAFLGLVVWLTNREPPHDDLTCKWCAQDPISAESPQWSQDAIRWLHRSTTVSERHEDKMLRLCLGMAAFVSLYGLLTWLA